MTPPLKYRIIAARRALLGLPTIFNFVGTVEVNEAEADELSRRGDLHFVSTDVRFGAPAGHMVRAPDGSDWVIPEDGEILLGPNGNTSTGDA